MTLNEIIAKVRTELNLPEDLVRKTYSEYWGYIRNTIEDLPLKDNLTQTDFSELRTNINVPSLGKINCTYERYMGMKERFNIINKIRNKP